MHFGIKTMFQDIVKRNIDEYVAPIKEDIKSLDNIAKENSESIKQIDETINLAQIEQGKIIGELIKKVDYLQDQIAPLRKAEENFFIKKSYAQAGEDSICAYVLKVLGYDFSKCTYLDLGANHAREMSNTYFFYENGAKGILVEANPQLISELRFYRHEDIILNKCIADKSGKVIPFYICSGDGLSSLDKNSIIEAIHDNPTLKLECVVDVETITVMDIIDKYLGEAPVILNIDVEGLEENILESIDFKRYRPLLIIVEMIDYQPTLVVGKKRTTTIDILKNKGYIEYAFTGINSIFIDSNYEYKN